MLCASQPVYSRLCPICAVGPHSFASHILPLLPGRLVRGVPGTAPFCFLSALKDCEASISSMGVCGLAVLFLACLFTCAFDAVCNGRLLPSPASGRLLNRQLDGAVQCGHLESRSLSETALFSGFPLFLLPFSLLKPDESTRASHGSGGQARSPGGRSRAQPQSSLGVGGSEWPCAVSVLRDRSLAVNPAVLGALTRRRLVSPAAPFTP